jgi:hypothetical protein
MVREPYPGQVPRQLAVPRGGQNLVHALVAFPGEGITLVGFQHFLQAVANAPVGAVEVTRHDEQHRQGQVMVSRIRQPQTAGDGVQAPFEGEEIGVGTPVQGEEGVNPWAKLGYRSAIRLLSRDPLMGQGNGCH